MFRPVFFSSFLATFLAFGEKQFWKIAMSPHTVQASSQDIKGFLRNFYFHNSWFIAKCGKNSWMIANVTTTQLKEKNWFRPAM
jgi:hypothetical protein